MQWFLALKQQAGVGRLEGKGIDGVVFSEHVQGDRDIAGLDAGDITDGNADDGFGLVQRQLTVGAPLFHFGGESGELWGFSARGFHC